MQGTSRTSSSALGWPAAPLKGALLGGLASVLLAAEVALLGLVEPDGAGPDAVLGAFELVPTIATGAVPVGALLGALAAIIRRDRARRLLAASLLGYGVATIVAVAQAKAGTQDAASVMSLALLAVAGYLVFAVPPILLTAFTLERWTRPDRAIERAAA